jgi:hypothetical protein
MAWISEMWNHAHARERVGTLAQEPPGSDIVRVLQALVFSAEDGDRKHVAFMKQVVDTFDWSPIAPKTLARNEDYSPGMELAGACVALLKGEKKAKSYLAELATTFGAARRVELKAVGRLADSVASGEWPGTSKWEQYPINDDELHEGMLESKIEDVLDVAHSPHGPLFGETINYLLPICLRGQVDAAPGKMLESIRVQLGPRASKRGELLYRRATAIPLRPDVLDRHVQVGIIAIDLGEQLHVYHDGFSWHQAKWKFDPESELARAMLELGDEQWADVRDNIPAASWKTIESKRESAQHILAVDPRMVRISEEARKRAESRFDIALEVVSFLET